MPKEKKVLKVPADYPSIGAAVNAAQPGDTIRVSKAIYHESVQITTSDLTLEGENGAVIQIDDSLFGPSDVVPGDSGLFVPGWRIGVLAAGPPIDTYTEHVKISGFTFQHSGKSVAAIGTHASRDCQITHNTIVSSGLGGINIHSNTLGLEIDHNEISRSTDLQSPIEDSAGIAFTTLALSTDPDLRRPSKDASVHHNRISGFQFGMRLRDFAGGSVEHNQCWANTQGLQLAAVQGINLSHNITNDSGPDSLTQKAAGISLRNVTSSTISHNQSNGNARGFLLRTDGPLLIGQGYPGSDADKVTHNDFRGNTMGDLEFEVPPPPGIVFEKNKPSM